MQSPIVVIDHVQKVFMTFPTGPRQDKRVEELLAAQRGQVATSGRPK